MRAITQTVVGGPEVLKLTELPLPSPGRGEVLVRVRAAGINPVDTAVRAGYYPLLGEPPFTIGWDISGVVEAFGPDVTGIAVGDEVFGMPRFPQQAAAYAEFAVAPGAEIAPKPANADHAHAAALPLAGLTAWLGLVRRAAISSGQRVLIHSGAGGVGHLAVQIAKARGAYVLATTSAEKMDFVHSLGADEVIDYKAENFVDKARNVDVVLETIGGDNAAQSLGTLRKGGVLVALLEPGDRARTIATEQGIRIEHISVRPDREGLIELSKLVDAGKLAVHVAKTFPLEAAGKAHAFLAEKPIGKVVLAI